MMFAFLFLWAALVAIRTCPPGHLIDPFWA